MGILGRADKEMLAQGVPPAQDGDNGISSILYPTRATSSWGSQGLSIPPVPQGHAKGNGAGVRTGGGGVPTQGVTPRTRGIDLLLPAEPEEGGKASSPAEGSALTSPLWLTNCVMASDPKGPRLARARGWPSPPWLPPTPCRGDGEGGGTR